MLVRSRLCERAIFVYRKNDLEICSPFRNLHRLFYKTSAQLVKVTEITEYRVN